MQDKNITLYAYELNADGTLKSFDTTTNAQPKEDCMALKISLKESLQADKLKIIVDGANPRVEHTEPLLEVVEGEFGYELVQETSADLININTADFDALLTLTGIGETKASAIIDYRTEHGPFAVPEDLMQVTGIGQSLYDGLKDEITV